MKRCYSSGKLEVHSILFLYRPHQLEPIILIPLYSRGSWPTNRLLASGPLVSKSVATQVPHNAALDQSTLPGIKPGTTLGNAVTALHYNGRFILIPYRH
jgi:hypothetical protein